VLGLIDEVVGDDDLLSRRHFVENQPTDHEDKKPESEEQGETKSEVGAKA
jgi:hypothetical protein